MTLFIALATGLLILTLLPVVLALRRNRAAEVADKRLDAYRARLAEMDNEARDGVIASEQVDSARRELEREMLQHVDGSQPVPDAPVASRSAAAIVIVLLVSVGALGMYLYNGHPDLIGVDTRAAAQPDVEDMVAKIAAHLKQNPEDQRGWEMLGRALMALGRYPEAAGAFERLYALTGDDANSLVRYADALAMSAGGKLGGKPTELINKALALEPHHRTALWLAGMAAMERGEAGSAIAHWQKLVPLLEDEETKAEVARLIERAGETPSTPAAATSAGITVRVEIAPELAAGIPADATVFITARAPAGPPLPLAVLKRSVSDLPFDVVLDDSLAMSPQHRLSQHQAVDITARISRSGRAERESGDWIAELQGVAVEGADKQTLTINTQVP